MLGEPGPQGYCCPIRRGDGGGAILGCVVRPAARRPAESAGAATRPTRGGSHRDRPRRRRRLPERHRLRPDARRARHDLRRRRLRRARSRPRSSGGDAVATGPGDGDAVRRGTRRPPGGRGGPRPHRLEVRPGAGPDRSRLRLLGSLGFRARLVAGEAAHLLLDRLLVVCTAQGLLKARGQQRTDSTHVLGALRVLSRLERVAEAMRVALEAVAAADPAWLQAHAPADWDSSLRAADRGVPAAARQGRACRLCRDRRRRRGGALGRPRRRRDAGEAA